VGPSGCGKSTILRLIARLLEPTEGTVQRGMDSERAGGANGSDRNVTGDRVGFVFQHPNLLPWRNVLANVGLPLELTGWERDSEAVAREACARVGLVEADVGKLPRMLSGGMQMRVSLARALVTRPSLLLMDEPFAAIDDMLRQQLNADVLRLWSDQRFTCVFVTHHLPEAVFLSQRVALMGSEPGRIVREFAIPFAYPRASSLRTSVEFVELLRDIDGVLRSTLP
ncbi:MAG TPA: ABC transporter ATP-binding protein, partial [Pirellulaceae bacterium]